MRQAETVLGVIRSRGQRGLHLEDAYRQLFNPSLYLTAYDRLYRNKGAMTKGVTRETVDGMSQEKVQSLVDLIRQERYQPTPVRRVYIPKANGKQRPLGIPTWTDKLVQEVVRSILDAYYEPQFNDHSYGFRPGRGCHDALEQVFYAWKGVRWFIEGDIKGCFDSIDHGVLLSILREKVRDGRFVALVEKMLRAGYLEDWRYGKTLSGTPQGGVVSPILSNIYLDKLDKFIEGVLVPRYTRGKKRKDNPEYRRAEYQSRRLHKRGQVEEAVALRKRLRTMPSVGTADPDYRRLYYVRYADDFLLGFIGPKEEADEIKAAIRDFLRDTLKLELSDEKTLVTHARTEAARFLGYDIAVMNSESCRSVNGKIELRLPLDVLENRCKRYSKRGKPTHRKILTHDSDFDIVARYGAEYRGFIQYYLLARNVGWAKRLSWVMQVSMCRTLAVKHKTSSKQMFDKYKSYSLAPDGRKLRCIQVVVRRDDKGKKPLVATFGGIQLKRQKRVALVDEAESVNPLIRSELLQRLQANECEVCGSTVRVQVHHVRALKDLRRRGQGDLPFWKWLMAARQRKTLVLCERCHTDLHAGRLDGRPKRATV